MERHENSDDTMQQQQFMQYPSPTIVATNLIQQYLDENNGLIYAIVHEQNLGKLEDSSRNLEKLQQNLTYLTALADNQPPQFAVTALYPSNVTIQPVSQYIPQQAQFYTANATGQPVIQLVQPQLAPQIMQPGSQFMQTPQAQQLNPQILMVPQPVMLHDQISQSQMVQYVISQDQVSQPQLSQLVMQYGQISQPQLAHPVMLYGQISQPQLVQPVMLHDQISQQQLPKPAMLHDQIYQSQMQQATLQGQIKMSSGGSSGLSMFHGQFMESCGILTTGTFPNVGSSSGAGNMLAGTLLSAPGQGVSFEGGAMTMPLNLSNSGQEGSWGVGSG